MTDLNQLGGLPPKRKMGEIDTENVSSSMLVNNTDNIEQTVLHTNQIEPPAPTYNNIPTEIIDLPSKGLLYTPGSELSKGQIRMKYMTAREEDILTNQVLIKKGTVLDELFKSMIVSPIKYEDLLIGDKNAIIVWARILSYGATYDIQVTTPSGKQMDVSVNLEDLKYKQIDESLITPGQNRFKFTTPKTNNVIEFKLLTVKDDREIDERQTALKKIGEQAALTTRLKQMILSVDGNNTPGYINQFISERFLASDSRDFRKYINEIQPNMDMSVELIDEETGNSFRTPVTIGLNFFWPDAES